jgi:hypothetical protein
MTEGTDGRGFNNVAEEVNQVTDRTWVKPVLERLSLKRALTGCGLKSDNFTAAASVS